MRVVNEKKDSKRDNVAPSVKKVTWRGTGFNLRHSCKDTLPSLYWHWIENGEQWYEFDIREIFSARPLPRDLWRFSLSEVCDYLEAHVDFIEVYKHCIAPTAL